ncbi:MAG: hydrolase [Pseudonocardiaceae bacterium]|nr:hydrolase [Pseudonocardiaceae bacterium]
MLLGATGTAVAVPPPPPNPSDSELEAGRERANTQAGRVGQLTNQLAEAESKLLQLQGEVAAKMEDANKALVDMRTAHGEAAQAERNAQAAKRESEAAAEAIERARKQLDEFIASSYRQGSTIGSISAYMSSDSPEDLLARSEMLEAVGSSKLDGLEQMQRARTEKANKDSAARAALERARQKQAAAERAKRAADDARAAAITARQDQRGRASELEASKADVEQQLANARAQVGGLEAQRGRYQEWLAAKQREEAAAAAASAAPQGGSGSAPAPAPAAPAGGSVETVISRALSQLGVTYAWGGGNGSGPTLGIRDGGVADSYGDYAKVGFDCSGLMIYAFAGVGISLDHYSGYQYDSGTKVPLSQMRRGDMLFWATGGRVSHVALYLGDGQMVEAPYSGSSVRIAPVRYGGIMPYATRLL